MTMPPDILESFFVIMEPRVQAVRDGRPCVVFLLPFADRVGHLVFDCYALKCLFDPAVWQIVVLYPERQFLLNQDIFDAAMQDLTPIECRGSLDATLVRILGTQAIPQGDVVRTETASWIFGGPDTTVLRHYQFRREGGARRFWRLTEQQHERGAALCRRVGITNHQNIAVMHARGPGYLKGKSDHHRHRDMAITNVVPAIEHLIDNGYVVVRLGDPTMEPLPKIDGCYDAALDPQRDPVADVYFAAEAALALHCDSGPTDLFRAFGRPMLCMNRIFRHQWCCEPNELMLLKRPRQAGRPLSGWDLLRLGLLDSYSDEDYQRAGVDWLESSADDILAATQELMQLTTRNVLPTPRIHAFVALCEGIHQERRHSQIGFRSFFTPAVPWSKPAQAWLEREPGFSIP